MQTWLHVVDWRATCDPDVIAIRDAREDLTYAQLRERIEERAGGWYARGIGSGDVVAVLAHNSAELLVNVLALMRVGALPLMLNWRMPAPEIARIIDGTELRGVFADPTTTDLVASDGLVTVVDGPDRDAAADATDVEDLTGPTPPRPVERLMSAQTAFLMHTSGTTGNPKIIPLDHGSLIRTLAGFAIDIGDQRVGCRHLVMMPLFHLAGFAQAMQCFLTGGTLIVHREFDVDGVLAAIAAERVNFFTAAPAILQMLVDATDGDRRATDLSSLIEVQYGAAPISPSLLIRAQDRICRRFRQIYGSTELQGFLTVLRPEDHRPDGPHLATAGRITQGWEVRIRTADGLDVAPGEPGELEIRGESLVRGYWHNPEATAAAWTVDGWYRTGDLASLDGESYLTIVGRSKEMIISGGENVYPAEIERVLTEHPAIAEAAVVGVPDDRWGEVAKAFVVVVDGLESPTAEPLTADDVLRWCRARLAGFKCPHSVDFIDALPRNSVGKIVKSRLG